FGTSGRRRPLKGPEAAHRADLMGPTWPREFARRPVSATVSERGATLIGGTRPMGGVHADVAQLVEHHLAKVRVAGSNPVVRSEAPDACRGGAEGQHGSQGAQPGSPTSEPGTAEWPSGLGKGLQSPVRGFDSRLRLEGG